MFELYEGDCLAVMPKLAQDSVAMVFCDLPYGQKKRQVTANGWDQAFDITGLWPALRAVRRDNAACIFTANLVFAALLISSNPNEFRHDLVYVKSRPTRHHHAHRMPLSAHEHVLIFAAKQPCYNPRMELRAKPMSYGGIKHASKNYYSQPNLYTLAGKTYTHRHPTTVLNIKSENGQQHPTQKPVALLEWLIFTYTNPGDTVLDPCFGSGTTGVACANLGRRFVGIEKDATYFAAAKTRIEQAYADAAARSETSA